MPLSVFSTGPSTSLSEWQGQRLFLGPACGNPDEKNGMNMKDTKFRIRLLALLAMAAGWVPKPDPFREGKRIYVLEGAEILGGVEVEGEVTPKSWFFRARVSVP